MVKTLERFGDSHALVLDEPILEMLGVGHDTLLQLTISGGSLVVTPVNVGVGRAEIDAVFDELEPRYGETLRRLAE